MQISFSRFSMAAILTTSLAASFHCNNYRKALNSYNDALPENEIRALRVVRNELKTRESIRSVIRVMKRNGFNVAIVQVRGRGDAVYSSRLINPAPGIEPGLDPLQEFIELATPEGIEVHAWVNVFLAAGHHTLRRNDPEHLINTRRDWFLKDRQGRSMLDYTRNDLKEANVEGAYLVYPGGYFQRKQKDTVFMKSSHYQ